MHLVTSPWNVPIFKPLRHQGTRRHVLRVAGNVRANMAQLVKTDKHRSVWLSGPFGTVRLPARRLAAGYNDFMDRDLRARFYP